MPSTRLASSVLPFIALLLITGPGLHAQTPATGTSIPVMTTTEINALTNPATRFLVYNSATGELWVNVGTPTSPIFVQTVTVPPGATAPFRETDGNVGTAGHVLGTTNTEDLRVITNNTTRMTLFNYKLYSDGANTWHQW